METMSHRQYDRNHNTDKSHLAIVLTMIHCFHTDTVLSPHCHDDNHDEQLILAMHVVFAGESSDDNDDTVSAIGQSPCMEGFDHGKTGEG